MLAVYGGKITTYRKLAELRPSADVLRSLAQVLSELGRADEAREQMSLAETLAQSSVAAP